MSEGHENTNTEPQDPVTPEPEVEETPVEETPTEPPKEETPQEPPKEEPPKEEEPNEPKEDKTPKPEDYKLPEGAPDGLSEFAAEAKMSQEQLDAALGYFGNFAQKQHEAQFNSMLEQGNQLIASWGEKATENVALAKQALQTSDPDGGLTKVLNETGYGNHPVVMNFFLEVGKKMKEGGFIKSEATPPAQKKHMAYRMYPSLAPKED